VIRTTPKNETKQASREKETKILSEFPVELKINWSEAEPIKAGKNVDNAVSNPELSVACPS
jgi:hypothetical protein